MFPRPLARRSPTARGTGSRSTSGSARRSFARSAIRDARIRRRKILDLELAVLPDVELEPDPVAFFKARRNHAARRAKRHGHRAHACARNGAVLDEQFTRTRAHDLAHRLMRLQRGRLRRLRALHARTARPQARLGIDEELAGDDHLVAFGEPLAYFALGHDDDAALAGAYDRFRRHEQRLDSRALCEN